MEKRLEFLEKWMSLREDEDRFKAFLKGMNDEEFMNLLIDINRNLRDIDSNEDVLSEGMIAGDLVAPTKSVRENTLKKLIGYIKKENDWKDVAGLTYYTLINLHMFSDGNGRTSRFLYDLISGDISQDQFMYYFHKGEDGYYDGKEDFEYSKGILDISYVNGISNSFLEEEIKTYLEKYPEINEKKIVVACGGFYTEAQRKFRKFFEENLDLDLSEIEKYSLAQILADNDGVQFTPGGIGFMMVADEKNEMNSWIKLNEEAIARVDQDDSIYSIVSNRMNFSIRQHPELLASWSSDDFRKVIKYGEWAKQKQYDYMIDIFENAENYSYRSDATLKNYIMHHEKPSEGNKQM